VHRGQGYYLPRSPGTVPAGMSASTSKPAIFTLSVVTSPEYLRMMAHSSAWTEALLPSPSRLRQRDRGRPLPQPQATQAAAAAAAAPLPCPVACQPGLQQLGQGGSSARPRACAHRQCPPKFPARGLKPTRQDPQSAGHRGPHRHQPSRQPPPCSRYRRCCLGGIRPPTELQGGLAWSGTSGL
jgi:hypothetical protein